MASDFANKLDDAAEGIIEFVVRLLRTAVLVIFNWKRLIEEILKDPRTAIVGPRVFLVAAVLAAGVVGEIDAKFWNMGEGSRLEALGRYFAELAKVKLTDALIRSWPFFVVALLASAVIRGIGPDERKLRDILQYAMGGVCLLLYPTLFLAAWLISTVAGNLYVALILTPVALVLALLLGFVARLRLCARRLQADDPNGKAHGGFLLFLVYTLALLATMVLLILRLFDLV